MVLLDILSILLIFVTLQLPPPDENHFPLQHRLFENFYGEQFCGRDVTFSLISRQAHMFWRNTCETPGSFLKLAPYMIPMQLFHLTLDGLRRRRQRRQKIKIILSIRSVLLMMWFRKYLNEDTLTLCFDIGPNLCYSYYIQNST